MPAAARVGDPTGHPGVIGPPGEPTVLIGGRPAATVGTAHQCASPAAHSTSQIAPPGSSTVLIGGRLRRGWVTRRGAARPSRPGARAY